MNTFSKKRGLLVIAAPLLLTAAVWLLQKFGVRIPCIFNLITGLQCPGCGNTRAALALLRLDWRAAFSFNPLFLPQFLYLAFVYLRSGIRYIKGGSFSYHSPCKILDYSLLVLFLLWGIIRNII